jgi:hypothetical protein
MVLMSIQRCAEGMAVQIDTRSFRHPLSRTRSPTSHPLVPSLLFDCFWTASCLIRHPNLESLLFCHQISKLQCSKLLDLQNEYTPIAIQMPACHFGVRSLNILLPFPLLLYTQTQRTIAADETMEPRPLMMTPHPMNFSIA